MTPQTVVQLLGVSPATVKNWQKTYTPILNEALATPPGVSYLIKPEKQFKIKTKKVKTLHKGNVQILKKLLDQ